MKKLMLVDWIFIALGVGLAGMALNASIPSDGDRAAEAYQQARNSGASYTQLCRSAKVVETAYRVRGEGSRADEWAQTARINCNGAALIEGRRRPY